jgi:Putative collagen-binding domain of a collagenase
VLMGTSLLRRLLGERSPSSRSQSLDRYLVSSLGRQIASGIPGHEYLVYDENGGSITLDLSGVLPTADFSVLWFDPETGFEQNGGRVAGGAFRTLNSPFAGDSVLLLTSAR